MAKARSAGSRRESVQRPSALKSANRAGNAAGSSHGRLLRLIAIFKFFKAASLIALSVGVFRMLPQDLTSKLERLVLAMRLDPGNRHVEMMLVRVGSLTPEQVKKLGIVGVLYAALFLVEGTGLWLQRRWGEWVTVIITSTLLPVEVYELFRHLSAIKVVVLLVNVGVVAYLVYGIRHDDSASA